MLITTFYCHWFAVCSGETDNCFIEDIGCLDNSLDCKHRQSENVSVMDKRIFSIITDSFSNSRITGQLFVLLNIGYFY